MNDYQILQNAPEGATHFDGKTYFRFEMYEHGQAYLVLKNGIWDRGLPAYPVYSCRCLNDIKRLIKWYQGMDTLAKAHQIRPRGKSITSGYVLVPVEPTEDMVWEAIRVMDEGMITVDQVDVKLAYKAMIQAAQGVSDEQP